MKNKKRILVGATLALVVSSSLLFWNQNNKEEQTETLDNEESEDKNSDQWFEE